MRSILILLSLALTTFAASAADKWEVSAESAPAGALVRKYRAELHVAVATPRGLVTERVPFVGSVNRPVTFTRAFPAVGVEGNAKFRVEVTVGGDNEAGVYSARALTSRTVPLPHPAALKARGIGRENNAVTNYGGSGRGKVGTAMSFDTTPFISARSADYPLHSLRLTVLDFDPIPGDLAK